MNSEMKPFWMVLSSTSNVTNVKHTYRDIAVNEARRLAAQNKGVKFYVLECIGAAITHDPVEWIEACVEEAPF